MMIKDIKNKADGDSVEVLGIVTEIAESVTRTNKPYVTGSLLDKADSVEFKCWDCTLEEFYKRYKFTPEDLTTTPVIIRGKVNIYNDVYSLVVTAVELSKEAQMDDFVYSAPYNPQKMYDYIVKKVNTFTSEDLKGITLEYLEWFKEKMLYYPYSSRHHNEKAGLLYHFYLCVARVYEESKVMPRVEGETMDYNKDVVVTAILFSRICSFTRYEVNKITGGIISKNEVRKALLGEYENLEGFSAFKRMYEKKNNKKVTDENGCDNVVHSLLSRYGIVKSATIEAVMMKNIIMQDLNVYEIHKEMCTLDTGESKQTLILGDNRRIVNLN